MDPLGQLLASLDAPQLRLLSRVLTDYESRADSLPMLRGLVIGLATQAEQRADLGQRRCSPFAAEKVATLASHASAVAEAWEPRAQDLEMDRDLIRYGRATGRAEALAELHLALMRHDAAPMSPDWLAEVPEEESAADALCDHCSGSGDGMHDGQMCSLCGGLGVPATTAKEA